MSAESGRGRLQFILLAILFFGPFIAAWWLYLGPADWRPSGTLTHGELFDPPRPLPELALRTQAAEPAVDGLLRGRWSLLYVIDGDCGSRCQARLYDARQIRLALGRDTERVQRVLLPGAACCEHAFIEREHADLIVLRADSPGAAQLRAALEAGGRAADRLYLVDPLGNLVVGYDASVEADGILDDIKRLLKLSRIG